MKLEVVFCYNNKWWAIGSKLIRWFEGRKDSHCAIILSNESTSMVYESIWPVGKKSSFHDWSKTYVINERIVIDPDCSDKPEIRDTLIREINKPYSVLQLLWIALGIVFKPFDKWAHKIVINGNKATICTELVATVLNKHYGVAYEESFDKLGLKDLKDSLSQIGGL